MFRFGGRAGRPLRVWLGSADLMERNLDRRVEVVVPVVDPGLQRRVAGILDDALRDQANSWELRPDGGVGPDRHRPPARRLGFSLQDQFQTQASRLRSPAADAEPAAA